MTSDQELRTMLEGTAAFDPAFRVQVLGRICTRARRRASIRRAAIWMTTFVLLGVLAKPLVPSESGAPALEAIVMALSLVTTVLLATNGSNRMPPWLSRIF
jgi:hypothetical protein